MLPSISAGFIGGVSSSPKLQGSAVRRQPIKFSGAIDGVVGQPPSYNGYLRVYSTFLEPRILLLNKRAFSTEELFTISRRGAKMVGDFQKTWRSFGFNLGRHRGAGFRQALGELAPAIPSTEVVVRPPSLACSDHRRYSENSLRLAAMLKLKEEIPISTDITIRE